MGTVNTGFRDISHAGFSFVLLFRRPVRCLPERLGYTFERGVRGLLPNSQGLKMLGSHI